MPIGRIGPRPGPDGPQGPKKAQVPQAAPESSPAAGPARADAPADAVALPDDPLRTLAGPTEAEALPAPPGRAARASAAPKRRGPQPRDLGIARLGDAIRLPE